MSVRGRVIFNIQIIMSGFSAENKRSIEAPTVHSIQNRFSSLYNSKYRGFIIGHPVGLEVPTPNRDNSLPEGGVLPFK